MLRIAASCCILATVAVAADDVPCPRFAAPPTIDGSLADWAGRATIAMSEPNVDDLKVPEAHIGWDAGHLYLAVQVRDHALVNAKAAGPELANGDCAELRLGGADGSIVRLVVAPTAAGGKPGLCLSRIPAPKQPAEVIATSADPAAPAVAGIVWAVAVQPDSWTVEASIPAAALKLDLAAGASIPAIVVVWDRDKTEGDEWKEWKKRSESASQKKPPAEWPRLKLAD